MKFKSIRYQRLMQGALIGVLLASAALALCLGRYGIPLDELLSVLAGQPVANETTYTVLFSIRIPRLFMAMIVGAGLSVAGLSLQAMFGNPLVSSDILGVSAAAGFGAALGILLVGDSLAVQVMAILFGFAGIACTYGMSRRRGRSTVLTLVLSGVIVGAVFQALVSLVKFVADPQNTLPAITYWLMGSLAGTSVTDVITVGPAIIAGIGVLWCLRWKLNVLSLPEDEAVSLGVNVKRLRLVVISAATVIAALTVSICGIVTFVGLAVPHFARMLTGNDHKFLLPACVLVGAVFMVLIDTGARAATPAEIPLSILTAIVGAPFFAVLLRRTGGAWSD